MSDSHADDKRKQADDMEYPDQAGYPDGMGTLDEGTRFDDADEAVEEIDDFTDEDTEDE